ncbi:MAG: hypothetical protein ACRDAU_07965 [Clostridium sp.]
MKPYLKLIIGLFLLIIGEISGANSNKILEYFISLLFLIVGFIILLYEIRNNYKVKLILKNIPGYRSNEKLNKIIATIYYSANILILTISMFTGIGGISLVGGCGSALVLPLMILSL